MEKKKFLIVASHAESLINFRGPLLKELLRKNLDLCVVAPDLKKKTEINSKLVDMGITTYDVRIDRSGLNPIRDALALFRLWYIMWRLSPDFALFYTIKPIVYGLLSAKLARVPKRYALITGLGYSFSSIGRRDNMVQRLARQLYVISLRYATKVFFQNPDDQELFRKSRLLNPHVPSVVVNGSGVDLNSFQPAPLPSELSFLLIARLLKDKGVREYIEAARIVKKKYPHAIFKIVGWIDENPNAIAESELNQWVKEGTVQYLGRLKDVRPAIAESSVYVLPSYREGTPRTVLEAMAMGRPIITTNAPGCKETVVEGDNGYLVPIKSVEPLIAAMLQFLEFPESVTLMGSRSRQIAEAKYDVNIVNNVMILSMGIN